MYLINNKTVYSFFPCIISQLPVCIKMYEYMCPQTHIQKYIYVLYTIQEHDMQLCSHSVLSCSRKNQLSKD